MDARQERGLKIAATCRIVQKNGQWVVPSQTGNGAYRVNLAPPTPFVPLCTCPDHEETGKPCKHVYAVQFVVERESNPDGSETVTKTLTVKERVVAERKTYPQCPERDGVPSRGDSGGGVPTPATRGTSGNPGIEGCTRERADLGIHA